jgi:hypothetical protein
VREAIVIRMTGALALVVALAGCGKLLGIADLQGPAGDAGGDAALPDASAPNDAAVDAAVDAAFDAPAGASTITGKLSTVDNFSPGSRAPVGNAAVALFRLPGDVEVSRTTTNGQGGYTLSSPTIGINGYVRGEAIAGSVYRATRHYLAGPLPAALALDVDLFSEDAIQALAAAQFGIQHMQTSNFAVVLVLESNGQPASGVVVSIPAASGVVRYSGSATQSSTSNDGIAYIFNIPPQVGTIAVDSQRNGVAFVGVQIELPPQTNAQLILQPPLQP